LFVPLLRYTGYVVGTVAHGRSVLPVPVGSRLPRFAFTGYVVTVPPFHYGSRLPGLFVTFTITPFAFVPRFPHVDLPVTLPFNGYVCVYGLRCPRLYYPLPVTFTDHARLLVLRWLFVGSRALRCWFTVAVCSLCVSLRLPVPFTLILVYLVGWYLRLFTRCCRRLVVTPFYGSVHIPVTFSCLLLRFYFYVPLRLYAVTFTVAVTLVGLPDHVYGSVYGYALQFPFWFTFAHLPTAGLIYTCPGAGCCHTLQFRFVGCVYALVSLRLPVTVTVTFTYRCYRLFVTRCHRSLVTFTFGLDYVGSVCYVPLPTRLFRWLDYLVRWLLPLGLRLRSVTPTRLRLHGCGYTRLVAYTVLTDSWLVAFCRFVGFTLLLRSGWLVFFFFVVTFVYTLLRIYHFTLFAFGLRCARLVARYVGFARSFTFTFYVYGTRVAF